MELAEQNHLRLRLIAITCSLLVGMGLMALKFYVYKLTHSSAVLSDALESIINVVASAFAMVSIVFAAKPPDESHPYGHGKIEYFSAGFEGALIILAALGIFITAWTSLLTPKALPHLEGGLSILLGTALINLFLGAMLVQIGKRTKSLTLVADGKHVLTDVYTSGGVILGLFMVHLTGYYWMDGVIACAMGCNILISGGKLVGQSFAGLMDASDPELLKEISILLNKHRKNIWIDIHKLRAWRSGNQIHIDFHLILPREFTLEMAHREVEKLEEIVSTHFEGLANALIHVDPCIDGECPICVRHRCELRRKALEEHITWKQDTITASLRPGK